VNIKKYVVLALSTLFIDFLLTPKTTINIVVNNYANTLKNRP